MSHGKLERVSQEEGAPTGSAFAFLDRGCCGRKTISEITAKSSHFELDRMRGHSECALTRHLSSMSYREVVVETRRRFEEPRSLSRFPGLAERAAHSRDRLVFLRQIVQVRVMRAHPDRACS